MEHVSTLRTRVAWISQRVDIPQRSIFVKIKAELRQTFDRYSIVILEKTSKANCDCVTTLHIRYDYGSQGIHGVMVSVTVTVSQ